MNLKEALYPHNLEWIRKKTRSGDYCISEHVIRYILFGKITISDIEKAMSTGMITETRMNRQRKEAWLIRAHTNGDVISSLCTRSQDDLMILLILKNLAVKWEEFDWIPTQGAGFMTERASWCFFCGGKIKPVVVGNFDYRLNGNLYVVKNVPAGLCLECGEKYISAETAKKINIRVLSNDFNGTEAVGVLSYE